MTEVPTLLTAPGADLRKLRARPDPKPAPIRHGLRGLGLAFLLLLAGCAGMSPAQRAAEPLFLPEYDLGAHGRKSWYDRVAETNPGHIDMQILPAFRAAPPRRIAVLPFVDRGSGNYVLDKVALTLRDKKSLADWRWTDANRLRRVVDGFLSAHEFVTVPVSDIDAVLALHGIDDDAKLARVPPQTLAQWLNVDAVVYGEVEHYEVYYLFLVAGWEVTLKIAMASRDTGETLLHGEGTEYKLEVRPAVAGRDIGINSLLDLTDLRDVDLRRDEEEVSRELILRIPADDAKTGLPPPLLATPAAALPPTAEPPATPVPATPLPLLAKPTTIAQATGYGMAGMPDETFFLPEHDLDGHGRKTMFDRLLETDPESFAPHIAADYCAKAPHRIAVLPFAYEGSGNLIVDGVPVTLRSQDARARWRWTYANRVRETFTAFLAQREFSVVPIPEIDAALAAHGITTIGALEAVSPAQLGAWLGADTLIRGDVTAYQGIYAFLVGGWRVGWRMDMERATDNDNALMDISGGRYAVAVQLALVPIDLYIDSGLSLLKLRDVRLRRAEEEVAREFVLRIPRCPEAKAEAKPPLADPPGPQAAR